MASEIPYMAAPGAIAKILDKIKNAATPETFSGDFLSTKLGFKGGNYLTFISWSKKCGLLNSDGSPTMLYKQFRNPSTSGASLASALKVGYSELYARNEYCHELDKKNFKGLVMEATGEAHDSAKVDRIVSTFFNAKELADFESQSTPLKTEASDSVVSSGIEKNIDKREKKVSSDIKLGLNYTINLVLPKTDDPSIYNAIFKSLKENLLND
ncbi:DUF5343 domain-containing protein [Pedobacter sp. AJM]|uniref:DUF5343 domain-containing protein n=1 Tax=Pedobacter sp. AJM TaxID=2003629 RepID=UPI000B4B439C|nr:DUF5343 domain-containing protein [Pedobacter sp. AJM]OWK71978.1 hypothetical protein CBW18_05805 [Pedobacter sp. AJM]